MNGNNLNESEINDFIKFGLRYTYWEIMTNTRAVQYKNLMSNWNVRSLTLF